MADIHTRELNHSNFEDEVLSASLPVLVDFWGEGCPPCNALAPTIDELAVEYEGRVRVGKVNVSNDPSFAARYGISAVPTVILFHEGQVRQQLVGLRPKRALAACLDELLNAHPA